LDASVLQKKKNENRLFLEEGEEERKKSITGRPKE